MSRHWLHVEHTGQWSMWLEHENCPAVDGKDFDGRQRHSCREGELAMLHGLDTWFDAADFGVGRFEIRSYRQLIGATGTELEPAGLEIVALP